MNDEGFDRLVRATEGVKPRASFTDRVMAAVVAEQAVAGWWSDLPRAGRRLVPVLAVVAVLAIAWAFRSTREVDDAFASSLGSMEIEW